MREIGAFEAKSKLGQLLDWVEAGEEVVITRRGKVVARLVPPDMPTTASVLRRPQRASASLRRGVTLGGADDGGICSTERRP